MPEPTRQYMFTEAQVRNAFVAVTTVMVLVLVGLLLLITAQPQGQAAPYDNAQFRSTVEAATSELEGFRQLDDGRVQLDIEHAIQLVAQRGVSNPFTAAGQGAGDESEAGETAAEGDAEAAGEAGGAADGAQAELPDGSQVYSNCAACHGANGQGTPSVFPPLAGHGADLYAADPAYLAQVVLFGLQGPITVDGNEYSGMMPAWQSLSDEQIAAVLNYVLTSWGNEEQVAEEQPYDSGFIAEQRELELTPAQVHERRQELQLP